MRTGLTTEQVERFRSDGFIVIEDLLDATELARWRVAFDRARQRRRNEPVPHLQPAGETDYYDRVFDQEVNLWQTDAGMRELVLDARLGRMAAELAGLPAVRLWHDQALTKQPYGNPTSFHLDLPYWPFSSTSALSIWIALDDATEANGCLYFFRGSHLETTGDNVEIGPNLSAIFDTYPQFASRPAVSGAMKAGSCSFHNCKTIHGAGANMTNGTRRAMFCAFIGDGVRYDGTHHVVTDAQASSLGHGDRLDDSSYHPLVYAADAGSTLMGPSGR